MKEIVVTVGDSGELEFPEERDRTRDADEAFWTPEWQAKEREADGDIAAGRLKSFDSAEAMLADLDRDRSGE